LVKFPDKNRHQLFLEPEGYNTNEVYLNGFSTSLPAQLQQEMVTLIPGFEEAQIIRPGYAIEYDFVDPKELTPFLETTAVKGLFLAGQINGTTGYEEAACQGLIAGINAALSGMRRAMFQLDRAQAYIGVLIDDLITNGVDEPYRMFTSRSEHRLLLRHDNADARLGPLGRELGLVDDGEWDRFNRRRARVATIRSLLDSERITKRDDSYSYLGALTGQQLGDSLTLAQLALRPHITSQVVRDLLPKSQREVPLSDLDSALADLLYSGYLRTQDTTNRRLHQHDLLRIPVGFTFAEVKSLSHEMVERLERSQPRTFGQARKLPGLTPAALSHLLVHLTAAQQQARG